MTMQLGRGLGPYRIGMRRAVHANLVRTIRQPENDGPGCSGGFIQDSYVDVYPGLRLGYGPGLDGKGYLDTIATTRRGDRTSLGYAIGHATPADVRKRIRRSGSRGTWEAASSRSTARPARVRSQSRLRLQRLGDCWCGCRPAWAAARPGAASARRRLRDPRGVARHEDEEPVARLDDGAAARRDRVAVAVDDGDQRARAAGRARGRRSR